MSLVFLFAVSFCLLLYMTDFYFGNKANKTDKRIEKLQDEINGLINRL